MESAALQVPPADSDALTELVRELDLAEPSRIQPFDGEAMSQVLIGITIVTLPVVKLWIAKRADSRSSYRVVVDGAELTGYTANEVQAIMSTLDRLALPPGRAEGESDPEPSEAP